MGSGFFNKDIPKKCEYCKNGTAFSGGKQIFCKKKGVVEPLFSCRSYKYDVLKRTPKSEIISTDYSPDDFKL